jgi:hypothetical protein
MRGDTIQRLLKNESWDVVLHLVPRTHSEADNPDNIELISCNSIPITEFNKKGLEMLIGPKKPSNDPSKFPSSALIVNVSRIKQRIDHMVGRR